MGLQWVPVNAWALLAAAAARMALGALWYSPPLFMRQWREMAGLSESDVKAAMPRAVAVDAAGSVVLAFVLLHAVVYSGARSAGQALFIGFWNWLGFIGVVTLAASRYERRPFKYWAINNGFHALAVLGMSVILTLWR